MPFFFIPTNQLALTAVLPEETASAAGLSNFMRTLSAAFGTSIITTAWDNASTRNHVNLAGALNDPTGVTHTLTKAGLTPDQALAQIEGLTQSQAVMTATDQMFMFTTLAFVVAAAVVWISPKPRMVGGVMTDAGGH
jgi:DHA2 family multidrug resistance protein